MGWCQRKRCGDRMGWKTLPSWILKIHNTLLYTKCAKKSQRGERIVQLCLIQCFSHYLAREAFCHLTPIKTPQWCCTLEFELGNHGLTLPKDTFGCKICILVYIFQHFCWHGSMLKAQPWLAPERKDSVSSKWSLKHRRRRWFHI